jgi:acyl-CoA dehydrogenase
MEYRFSEDQQMIKKALDSLLKREVRFEVFTEIVEKKDGFSKDLWKKLAENGWLGILAKGDIQTLDDMSSFDLVYLCESFGERLFPGPYSLVAGFIVPFLTQVGLTNNQKELLSLIVSGEKLITAVLPRTENGKNGMEFNGSDIKIMKEESDRIQVKGEIQHVPFVQHSDTFLLPIKSVFGGISVALINTDHDGVMIVPEQSHDLSKPQGTIVLDGVWIHNEDFIEERASDHREKLYKQLMNYFICLNGEMLGGANEVLERTVAFVKERKQFGVPVGSFQAVKHMVADMYSEIEKARSFNTYVAYLYEQNPDEHLINVASSRLFTSQMYKNVCEEAIQLHGGMGFTWEEGVHFWYKASMYHLYHVTHPTVLNEYILQDLLLKE